MWHRVWHSSIKNRLTFLFFSITAGAILVFYFYVVPQLESTLTQQKLDALKRDSSASSAILHRAIEREVTARELDALTRDLGDRTGTRVTLLNIPVDEVDPQGGDDPVPYVISDSSRAETNLQPANDLVRRAFDSGKVRTTTRAQGGGKLAQAARPLFYQGRPSWVVVFSEPLDEVEDNVGVDPAADPRGRPARARARDGHRLLRRKRDGAPREAARAGCARDRRRETSPSRSRSIPRTSWASSPALSTRCSSASRASTPRARSSSPTHRTSCAPRSSRWADLSSCFRTRTSTRRPATSSSRRCASRWTASRS